MATGNKQKNFVKIGLVVFELCEQTDTRTNKLTYRLVITGKVTRESSTG